MRRELAADVYAEAARLFRAVEDLLVLTRLEHDAVRVTREPISLIRAVDAGGQVEAAAGPACRSCSASTGRLPPAAADPNALAHALRNLIANIAWRAGGAGRPRDRRRCARQARRVPDARPNRHPHDGTIARGLFELPATDPGPGSVSPGIAMYVAGRLIEAMRGRTWVADGEAGAVEIGFSLPCYESAA